MENKVYTIRTMPVGTRPDAIDWTTVPAAKIDTYAWEDRGYEPAAEAAMVFVPDFGFVLRMTCAERAPKAVYTQYNEPVYTDSCMEFFAAWRAGDARYMNMEMNAKGTLLSCVGADRHVRTPIRDLTGGELPRVTGHVGTFEWSLVAEIPMTLLGRVFDMDPADFKPGYRFSGNFYKCGDETAVPHYGMWNPVRLPKADFHRPEFFGTFIIG